MDHLHAKSYVEQAITVTSADDPGLADSWERIFVPSGMKERLVNHALMAIELRKAGVSNISLPLHGLLLLAGRPGVGKTSLARGLASEVARALGGRYGAVRLVDINLHVLPSELLGRTQRNIVQLFEEELPVLAESGPLIVVLDEIEALGVSRSQLSLEINPADIFRGTAALLSAFDWIARETTGVVVVGTTNVLHYVDAAITSRADLVIDLPTPSVDVIGEILEDSFRDLSRAFPGCKAIIDSGCLDDVAALLEHTDGRQTRKFIADALASQLPTATDPGKLTAERLVEFATTWAQAAPNVS